MRKITLAMLACGLSLATFAQTWNADKAHSQLTWNILHMGINNLAGSFQKFSATITSSKDDWSDASVQLMADVRTINTGIDARDNHLKSAAFFDAANDSTLSFKSTSWKHTDGKNYVVTGDLTLHGVTKTVTLNVTFNGQMTDQKGNAHVGFHIAGVVKRTDFNIASNFPASALSDEVNLDANFEFVKG